jgi:hypothetical protein
MMTLTEKNTSEKPESRPGRRIAPLLTRSGYVQQSVGTDFGDAPQFSHNCPLLRLWWFVGVRTSIEGM